MFTIHKNAQCIREAKANILRTITDSYVRGSVSIVCNKHSVMRLGSQNKNKKKIRWSSSCQKKGAQVYISRSCTITQVSTYFEPVSHIPEGFMILVAPISSQVPSIVTSPTDVGREMVLACCHYP
jgi:hypothetical protein